MIRVVLINGELHIAWGNTTHVMTATEVALWDLADTYRQRCDVLEAEIAVLRRRLAVEIVAVPLLEDANHAEYD